MNAPRNEIRELLEWYQNCDRAAFPRCPFKLKPWQTVTGDEFFTTIKREVIEAISFLDGDSSCPPVRVDGLLKDLEALQQLEDIDDW